MLKVINRCILFFDTIFIRFLFIFIKLPKLVDKTQKNNIITDICSNYSLFLGYQLMYICRYIIDKMNIYNINNYYPHNNNFFNRNIIINVLKDRHEFFLNNIFLQNITLTGCTHITNNMFHNCVNLKKIYIPETVLSIDYRAFKNCVNLKKVYIPQNIQCIKFEAFKNCVSLETIIFY